MLAKRHKLLSWVRTINDTYRFWSSQVLMLGLHRVKHRHLAVQDWQIAQCQPVRCQAKLRQQNMYYLSRLMPGFSGA